MMQDANKLTNMTYNAPADAGGHLCFGIESSAHAALVHLVLLAHVAVVVADELLLRRCLALAPVVVDGKLHIPAQQIPGDKSHPSAIKHSTQMNTVETLGAI